MVCAPFADLFPRASLGVPRHRLADVARDKRVVRLVEDLVEDAEQRPLLWEPDRSMLSCVMGRPPNPNG